MTAARDLPRLYGPLPGAPRTETAVYFADATAFGSPHARPAPPPADDFGDDPEAGIAVGSGPVVAPSSPQLQIVQGIAAALQAELDQVRRALLAESEAREAAEFSRDLETELRHAAESRCELLADDAAQLRAQCAAMRDDVAATTVDAVRIALDRAARAIKGLSAAELTTQLDDETQRWPDSPDEMFDASDIDCDTVVVDTEHLAGGAR